MRVPDDPTAPNRVVKLRQQFAVPELGKEMGSGLDTAALVYCYSIFMTSRISYITSCEIM